MTSRGSPRKGAPAAPVLGGTRAAGADGRQGAVDSTCSEQFSGSSAKNSNFLQPDSQPGEVDGGAGFLPCLSSNNSTETASKRLSTQHRKSASVLAWNVSAFVEKFGIDRVGFLTLTFRDHVTDAREAQRRFNSLATHVIRPRYHAWVGVWERQKSGRIHYHLLVALSVDIRTGFDFAGIAAGDYSSANSAIRLEWSFWRSTAPAYGFGRTELLPVRSTGEGVARYVGKYIGKHMEARRDDDKGFRLVRYSQGWRIATTRFQWATEGAQLWRLKLRAFAWIMAAQRGCSPTMAGLASALGPRWAYQWREFILALPCGTE